MDSADFELKANLTKYELSGKMELGDGVESYNAANPFGGGADTCIIAKNQFDKTDGVDVLPAATSTVVMDKINPTICKAKVNLTLTRGIAGETFYGSVKVAKDPADPEVLVENATYETRLSTGQFLQAKYNAANKWVVTLK